MELAGDSREPCMFAVAKLLDTGLVNLFRIDMIWKRLSLHLIQVCRNANPKTRECGAKALTTIALAAVSVSPGKLQSVDEKDTESNFRFLAPLQDLSDIPYPDIRQKQLSVCLQMIQSTGERLQDGWPQVLDIVGSLQETHSDNLIRLAFQCLQLITSDYLNNIPAICLVLLVDTTAKFASQSQELNVSLTAIGCLWNVADFLHHNHAKIRSDLTREKTEKALESQLHPFECLWTGLFSRLGHLCCDPRPPVRKSSAQTLFSGLTTHADILQHEAWHSILWKILFPLMDKVNTLMNEASDEKIVDASKSMGVTGVGSSGSILLHHTRNTAHKQWAETQVLVLSGVCKVVSDKREVLASKFQDFDEAWRLILRNIETSSSPAKNAEVSQSALKCFQDLLSSTTKRSIPNCTPLPESFWQDAWLTWCKMGEDCTSSRPEYDEVSQAFLNSYIQIFPCIIAHVRASFTREQCVRMSGIFEKVLGIPVDSTTQAFLVTVTASAVESLSQESVSSTPSHPLPLTPLQESVFASIESFCSDLLTKSNQRISKDLLIPLFNLLLSLVTLSSTRRRLSDASKNGMNGRTIASSVSCLLMLFNCNVCVCLVAISFT